jgi:GTP-binding protein HflX
MSLLREIGAESTPQILVLNKLDLLNGAAENLEETRLRVLGSVGNTAAAGDAVAVSARTGAGIAGLLARIDAKLPLDPVSRARFRIPHSEGSASHFLHEFARVVETRFEEEYSEIVADAPESVQKRLSRFRLADEPAGRGPE